MHHVALTAQPGHVLTGRSWGGSKLRTEALWRERGTWNSRVIHDLEAEIAKIKRRSKRYAVSLKALTSLMTSLSSVLLGLATHAIFHFHEPRHPLVPVSCTLCVLPLCALVYNGDFSLKTTLLAYAAYLVTLSLSIVLYRLSPFHPLAQYPGPLMLKATKLAGVWVVYTGRNHLMLKKLHDKHGPIVRIGPNDISVADAEAVPVVLGPNGLPKGRYYDGRRDPNAPMNLLTMESKKMHTRRRRLWSRGLGNESLKDYEGIIAERAQELVAGLERRGNGAVDVVQWINYLTFDFMGDMAFGEAYGMLRAGADTASFWEVLEKFASSVAMMCHVPWAMPLVQRMPFMAKDLLKLRKFGVDSAMARLERGPKSKDLWYYLADEPGHETQKPEVKDVAADGTLAIVAGADTTSSAMSSLLYFTMTHPECLRRVHEEIDDVYADTDHILDSSKHGELKYLNACINETLRLHPPVPTSGPRQIMKGAGSKLIAGRMIPEHTQIWISPYVLHRDARYYPDAPDSFVPDRWLDGRENQDPATFIPFSYGPANCVGRHLARREMLIVLSLLFKKFEFQFAEGFDREAWPDTLHDYFVSARGPLLVQLKAR